MKIILGSDHGGFEIKEKIKEALSKLDYKVTDAGCANASSCDYPDFAFRVAGDVAKKIFEFGILVCGSGIGMSITANKFKGIRAALVWNAEVAKLAREHNDSNILCLPGRFLTPEEAVEITRTWLSTAFSGGRHSKRLEKIERIEKESMK